MVREVLSKLAEGQSLSFAEAAAFVDAIASGDVGDAQIAAFLTGLRIKGESAEELAGCVSALRRHAVNVPHKQKMVFDCCGTGGDGSNTFNISTAAAVVIAACGVPTAKHGNRAVSSACGSADILEEAGARIDISPEHSARLFDEIGFCFLFAPLYHPATKRVAAVRRELGFRTIFNLMGPLLNPARATHQIIGTSSPRDARLLAAIGEHVPELNMATYYNSSGVDELLPVGTNVLCQWLENSVQEKLLPLSSFLQNGFQLEAIRGGDRKVNLVTLTKVLSGDSLIHAKVTALNAALGLVYVGKSSSFEEGYDLAMDAIRSGAAKRLFRQYISLSHEVI